MIDFHCHLDLYPKARDVHAEVLKRNVFTWLVTTSPMAYQATTRVLGSHPEVLITPGLHPEIVHERYEELEQLLAQIGPVKAVGEVGLDGSKRFQHSYEMQRKVFTSTIETCHRLGGRALSIHSRQAVGDVLSILKAYPDHGIVVLHWFTGTATELKSAAEANCWFSIGPAAFNSTSGKALAKKLPKDRVVPESDGPFAQVGGKTVQPWSFELTAKLLSEAWGLPEVEVQERLKENARRLLTSMGYSLHIP
ncbi:TatD DNase family protein [Pseudomonas extremaustralis]|uniref:Qat anti-phage system TatD family nuclease QatD n=1 Tax=Pseudomonas TaxID=286 RepID=UPI000646062C|nr:MULTISPECIES: Qat anti-phage system TatD family nuclease QatD [Pseudomonas]SKB07089.1 TatD DNase family protein [Pseudomonas extremaustralis]